MDFHKPIYMFLSCDRTFGMNDSFLLQTEKLGEHICTAEEHVTKVLRYVAEDERGFKIECENSINCGNFNFSLFMIMPILVI